MSDVNSDNFKYFLDLKERLEDNLTSKQIISLLNTLINKACRPMFENSVYMRECLFQSVLQTQDDHRRKIAVEEKQDASRLIINAVLLNNYDFIEQCEPNRSILFSSITKCLDALEGVVDLERKIFIKTERLEAISKLREMSLDLGMDLNKIGIVYKWCKFYCDMYIEFKSMIMEKYIRESYNQAKFEASRTGLTVDVKDITENFMLAVSKAIDKCDAGKGTLTSYIKRWMLSARTNPEFSHELGVAYDMPAAIKRQRVDSGEQLLNMSVSLVQDVDTPDEDVLTRMQSIFSHDEEFLKALRGIKNAPLLFMGIGIPPILTESECEALGKTGV